jgi:hypothetical protein
VICARALIQFMRLYIQIKEEEYKEIVSCPFLGYFQAIPAGLSPQWGFLRSTAGPTGFSQNLHDQVVSINRSINRINSL